MDMKWEAKGSYVFEGRNCIGICDTDNADAATYERRAKIMAAAPDLLEAVSELVEQWNAFEASSGNMEEAYYKLAKYARPSWKKAIDAAAKATGKL